MTQRDVVVELQGGLGNQLFGWAAGYVLSKKLSCGLALDISQLHQRGYQLDSFNFGTSVRIINVKRKLTSRVTNRFKINIYREEGFRHDVRFENISSPKTLQGYFQSWKYHVPFQDEIYANVRTLANVSDEFENLNKKFNFEDLTAVHVRRGDYKTLEEYHGTVKVDYYEKALESVFQIEGRMTPFVVFSDEPEEARKVVPGAAAYLGPETLLSPAESMILMSRCKALIGANSSFSLWAGLLMMPQEKIRIFPNRWFAKHGIDDSDLVPTNFIRMDQ
jgi:hypothetical protein